jgi:hypothetical protein
MILVFLLFIEDKGGLAYLLIGTVTLCVAGILANFPLHIWRTNQAVGYFQQSAGATRVEARPAPCHIATADTLRSLFTAYWQRFQPSKATQLRMQVLEIEDRTMGPLSGRGGGFHVLEKRR